MYNVDAYDYNLPEELIADYPKDIRDSSMMLILDRNKNDFKIKTFASILDFITSEDCIVLNNTQVLKARFYGLKEGVGAKIEAMLISPVKNSEKRWNCFIKPGKRVKSGTKVKLIGTDTNFKEEYYKVITKKDDGSFVIEIESDNVNTVFENYGNIPLPPYIKRKAEKSDETRYQTVFSKNPGAVAAPTAGLHFTKEILEKLHKKGVKKVELTLHVGAGTFQPVSVEDIRIHKMHSEEYFLSDVSADIINETKKNGGRIFAIGTTSARVLETLSDNKGYVKSGCGYTDIFIHPPMKPKTVDCLLTNFHLPKSTLIMLVSSFATREKILNAYKFAIEKKMRFYSYGDCMLII